MYINDKHQKVQHNNDELKVMANNTWNLAYFYYETSKVMQIYG